MEDLKHEDFNFYTENEPEQEEFESLVYDFYFTIVKYLFATLKKNSDMELHTIHRMKARIEENFSETQNLVDLCT